MDTLDTLVTAAQSGDLDAFGHIVQRFQGMAYASAYAMLEDGHLAEDVAQEAFIEAYINLSNLRDPAAFPGWFRRIVFKQGDRFIRGKHLTTVPLEQNDACDLPMDHLNPALIVEDQEQQNVVRHAVETLPERERMVILLFYGSGYALKEIADYLEVPATTIKKRLFDARKHLKLQLMETVGSTLREQQHSYTDRFSDKVRLLIAIRLGDLAQVKSLLERYPLLINTKMVWQIASTSQSYPMFPAGYTALHEAAACGQTALVDLLLAFGANVNARTSSGITPLRLAVLYNHVGVVRRLLSHHADMRGELCRAAMREYREIVEWLLAHGVEVNAQEPSGRTALHWAALKGYGEMVQLLLQHGADGSIQDELGRTPADWAVARGHHDLADQLRPTSHVIQERPQLGLINEKGH